VSCVYEQQHGHNARDLDRAFELRHPMMMRFLSSGFALLVFLTQPAQAQQPSQKIDVSRLGPQVGEVVSDFRLQDAQGKVWTRDSIMGSKGAMLVFSRSADW
jgi:hypothetical protein